MAERNKPIRVLVVDDEPEIRDAYKQILCDTEVNLEMTGFHELRSRLFRKNPSEALRHAATRTTGFETVFCQQASEAVAAVKEALARNEPFAVAFIDMRIYNRERMALELHALRFAPGEIRTSSAEVLFFRVR